MTLADRHLLDRLEAGDDRALAGLYRRHHRGLLAFTRHLVSDQAKAEEAVRIAFDRLRARAAAGRAPVDARSALYRYARNACAAMPAAPAISGTGLPPMVREEPELQGLLRDISRLSVDERAALVLFDLRQLPEHEIAAVLGRQVNEVQALLTSARTALAQVSTATPACEDVQAHLSTLRGRALIPMRMRAHIRQCDDCRRFRAALIAQRRGLAALLPIAPSAGLARSVLGRASGRTKSTAGAGAAAGLAILARRARANPAVAGVAAVAAAAAVALSVGGLSGGDGAGSGGGGGDGSPAGAVAGANAGADSDAGGAGSGAIAAEAKPPTTVAEVLESLTPLAAGPGNPEAPGPAPDRLLAFDPAPHDDRPEGDRQPVPAPPGPTRPPPASVDPGPGDPQPTPPAGSDPPAEPDPPASTPPDTPTPPARSEPPPAVVPEPAPADPGGPPGNPTAPGKGPGKMPPGTPGTPGPPGGSPGPPPGTPPNGG